MTQARERMMTALDQGKPDCLPVDQRRIELLLSVLRNLVNKDMIRLALILKVVQEHHESISAL